MSVIITLRDIDEAIENLKYKNETTLKYKLTRAIRLLYSDESSVQSLKAVDIEDLVKAVWETGDDQELIKVKRKNFSSTKSGINNDLKKLFQDGKNPQGIIIGHNNIFDISDEAKNKALSSIADVFKEKGIDTGSRLTEILATLSDILSTATSTADAKDAKEEIDRLKNLIGGISQKLGFSLQSFADAGGEADKTGDGGSSDISANIDALKKMMEDDAAGRVAMESGLSGKDKANFLAGISDILKNKEIDGQTRLSKIVEAVQGLLTEAISSAGEGLSGEEAQQIKDLFGDLAGKIGAAAGEITGEGSDAGSGAAAEAKSGGDGEGIAEAEQPVTTESGDGEGLSSGSKVDRIMSAVNETLSQAFAAPGLEINAEETDRIIKLFGTLSATIKSAISNGQGIDNIGIESGSGDGASGDADGGEIAEEAISDDEMEIIEEVEQAGAEGEVEEIIEEVLEDESAAQAVDESGEFGTEEYAPAEETEDVLAPDVGADVIEEGSAADEVVEIIEEMPDGELTEVVADEGDGSLGSAGAGAGEADLAGIPIAPGDIAPAEGQGLAGEGQVIEQEASAEDKADYEEIVEVDDSTAVVEEVVEEAPATASPESVSEETITDEALPDEIGGDDAISEEAEALPEDYAIEEIDAEEASVEQEDVEIIEAADAEEVEEVTDELPEGNIYEDAAGEGKITGEAIEDELRTRADILAELAEAAKALEKLGPDLNSSIYSEEEIKEKAKLLSEEFDRYLSVREKFYNQHILIKSGDYLVGAANRGKGEFPEQLMHLRDFYIGKFPVVNALFEIFVEKTGYITTAERYGFGMVYVPRMQKVKNAITGTESFVWNTQLQYKKVPGACWYHPSGPGSSLYVKRTHPVVQISLEDACAFAAWTGKRIPTEGEWEASTRTFHSYLYPWGNTWKDDACNLEKSLLGDTAPVDKYVKFANAFEVADALGNVLEWTMDPWADQAPDGDGEDIYVAKGASWISDSPVSLSDRQPVYKNITSNILGFRCIAI